MTESNQKPIFGQGPKMGGKDAKTDSKDLQGHNIHLLMDDISSASCRPAIEFILQKNLSDQPPSHLTLIINSYGGTIPDGFALVDVMRGSRIPIHTVGLGVVASCGLLIFIAGEEGHRTLTPNTAILSHQFSWGAWGKEHELIARVKEYELIGERLMRHYRLCTGLSDELIREKLLPAEDRWLSDKEALELNLCDQVKDI